MLDNRMLCNCSTVVRIAAVFHNLFPPKQNIAHVALLLANDLQKHSNSFVPKHPKLMTGWHCLVVRLVRRILENPIFPPSMPTPSGRRVRVPVS